MGLNFQNIADVQWIPEVNQACPGVPKILVCTKIDLRDDEEALERALQMYGTRPPVNTAEGEDMAKRIGAIAYVETSAMKGINVFRVLEEGINHMFQSFGSRPDSGSWKCCIM